MIQLEGSITIGGTDYSSDITECTIIKSATTTRRPATFGNSRTALKKSTVEESVRITFLNDVAAASFWAECWDALDTDTGELAFIGLMKTGGVGADNPSFTGTIVVLGAEAGGRVGEQNTQTYTFPVTEAGLTKAVA